MTPTRPEHRASRTLSDTPSFVREETRPRVSNVRVLNTSLPHVHEELLQAREVARSRNEDPDSILHPSQVLDRSESVSSPIPEEGKDERGNPIYRSKEEQEATSKALKPHSRSVAAMNQLRTGSTKPQGMTSMGQDEKKPAAPKVKQKKWQFGIRSRNAPYEAMKCLYSALRMQNADWEINPAVRSDETPDGEDNTPPPRELAPGERHTILQSKFSHLPSTYYVPRDPWRIRARFLKKGMLMPGEAPSLSAHSSAVSLPTEAQNQLKKHIEELGGYASDDVAKALGINANPSLKKVKSPIRSAQSTRPNSSMTEPSMQNQDAFTGPASQPLSRPESASTIHGKVPSENVGVWIYMDIQLYIIDPGIYVVDFKCDGYQNVVLHDPKYDVKSPNSTAPSPSTSRPASGFENATTNDNGAASYDKDNQYADEAMKPYWKPVSKRFKNIEKEISSPYPYLDVASDLVARLASNTLRGEENGSR